MRTVVRFLPSNVAKEIPEQNHQIPLKHIPFTIDDGMRLKNIDVEQFLMDEGSKSDNNDGNDGNNDNKDSNDVDSDDNRYADLSGNDFVNAVMDGYDNEDELDFLSRIGGLGDSVAAGPVDNRSNAHYMNPKHPNKKIKLSKNSIKDKNDGNNSDLDDIMIKKTDEIFVTLGSNEDQTSFNLEVMIFDTDKRHFYIHHDVILPYFPLCCKWLNYRNNNDMNSNLLAVGGINESIEIFDIDVMDALEPVCTLGGRNKPKDPIKAQKILNKYRMNPDFNLHSDLSPKLKNTCLGELKEGSHSDSIMCLDWHNGNNTNIISGSADNSIKIWDLNNKSCINTILNHKDKVQDIAIHLIEPKVFISGSFDKTCILSNINHINNKSDNKVFKLDGEVESLQWHPNNNRIFYVTLDNGYIASYDVRNESKPLISFKASKSNKPISCLSFNNSKNELFITGSIDGYIKIWYQNELNKMPQLLHEQKSQMGAVFSCNFAPKNMIPWICVFGGYENISILDIMSLNVVRKKYNLPTFDDVFNDVDITKHSFMEKKVDFNLEYKSNDDEDSDLNA